MIGFESVFYGPDRIDAVVTIDGRIVGVLHCDLVGDEARLSVQTDSGTVKSHGDAIIRAAFELVWKRPRLRVLRDDEAN